MKTFKDLEFVVHPSGGWASSLKFKNGYRLSVVCGEFAYCTPRLNLPSPLNYNSYEIALFNPDGDFVTRQVLGKEGDDDVLGWLSVDQINEKISIVETLGSDADISDK